MSACTLVLNTRIANETPNGYFVYLGRSTTSVIGTAGSNAFGIVSPLDNGVNGDTANDGVVANNPYTLNGVLPVSRFIPLTYSTSISFNNIAVGYYGFMYVVGDNSNTGNIPSILNNCGAVSVFEVEVIQSLPTLANATVNYCLSQLPPNINLASEIASIITGLTQINVTYGGSNPTLGTLSGSIITLNPNPPLGSYVYTALVSKIPQVHPISQCCDTVTINITINILANVSAGTGGTFNACN